MRDKENSKVEKTLMDLIDLSLSELGSISDEAKNHLISLAKEGFPDTFELYLCLETREICARIPRLAKRQ